MNARGIRRTLDAALGISPGDEVFGDGVDGPDDETWHTAIAELEGLLLIREGSDGPEVYVQRMHDSAVGVNATLT